MSWAEANVTRKQWQVESSFLHWVRPQKTAQILAILSSLFCAPNNLFAWDKFISFFPLDFFPNWLMNLGSTEISFHSCVFYYDLEKKACIIVSKQTVRVVTLLTHALRIPKFPRL